MSNSIFNCVRRISILTVVLTTVNIAVAQQPSTASLAGSDFVVKTALSENGPPRMAINHARVIEGLLRAETQVRESLKHYSFRRDVTLQTIAPTGEVTGEYIRNSQFVFDDRGNRIERVLFHPRSTIREMKITKEDIQDLAEGQLLGIDVNAAGKYQLVLAGKEIINDRVRRVLPIEEGEAPVEDDTPIVVGKPND